MRWWRFAADIFFLCIVHFPQLPLQVLQHSLQQVQLLLLFGYHLIEILQCRVHERQPSFKFGKAVLDLYACHTESGRPLLATLLNGPCQLPQ
jgi:hypothetical protein